MVASGIKNHPKRSFRKKHQQFGKINSRWSYHNKSTIPRRHPQGVIPHVVHTCRCLLPVSRSKTTKAPTEAGMKAKPKAKFLAPGWDDGDICWRLVSWFSHEKLADLSTVMLVCLPEGMAIHNWLVVEPYPSEKWWSEFVSWDDEIPDGNSEKPCSKPPTRW